MLLYLPDTTTASLAENKNKCSQWLDQLKQRIAKTSTGTFCGRQFASNTCTNSITKAMETYYYKTQKYTENPKRYFYNVKIAGAPSGCFVIELELPTQGNYTENLIVYMYRVSPDKQITINKEFCQRVEELRAKLVAGVVKDVDLGVTVMALGNISSELISKILLEVIKMTLRSGQPEVDRNAIASANVFPQENLSTKGRYVSILPSTTPLITPYNPAPALGDSSTHGNTLMQGGTVNRHQQTPPPSNIIILQSNIQNQVNMKQSVSILDNVSQNTILLQGIPSAQQKARLPIAAVNNNVPVHPRINKNTSQILPQQTPYNYFLPIPIEISPNVAFPTVLPQFTPAAVGANTANILPTHGRASLDGQYKHFPSILRRQGNVGVDTKGVRASQGPRTELVSDVPLSNKQPLKNHVENVQNREQVINMNVVCPQDDSQCRISQQPVSERNTGATQQSSVTLEEPDQTLDTTPPNEKSINNEENVELDRELSTSNTDVNSNNNVCTTSASQDSGRSRVFSPKTASDIPVLHTQVDSSMETALNQRPTTSRANSSQAAAHTQVDSSVDAALNQRPTTSRAESSKTAAYTQVDSSIDAALNQRPTTSGSESSEPVAHTQVDPSINTAFYQGPTTSRAESSETIPHTQVDSSIDTALNQGPTTNRTERSETVAHTQVDSSMDTALNHQSTTSRAENSETKKPSPGCEAKLLESSSLDDNKIGPSQGDSERRNIFSSMAELLSDHVEQSGRGKSTKVDPSEMQDDVHPLNTPTQDYDDQCVKVDREDADNNTVVENDIKETECAVPDNGSDRLDNGDSTDCVYDRSKPFPEEEINSIVNYPKLTDHPDEQKNIDRNAVDPRNVKLEMDDDQPCSKTPDQNQLPGLQAKVPMRSKAEENKIKNDRRNNRST